LAVGYDGGNWSKVTRTCFSDTLGSLRQVVVSAANMRKLSALEKYMIGSLPPEDFQTGYDGKDFITTVKEDHQLDWHQT